MQVFSKKYTSKINQPCSFLPFSLHYHVVYKVECYS